MKMLWLFFVLTIVGCASADPIILRHPVTGQTTTCPGYSTAPAMAAVSQAQQRNCVQDYQGQGYERAPQ
jgi:hypothetical protein